MFLLRATKMSKRRLLVSLGVLLWALLFGAESVVSAQSNVRPMPRLARLPEAGAEFARRTQEGLFQSGASHASVAGDGRAEKAREVEGARYFRFDVRAESWGTADFEDGAGQASVQRMGWDALIGRELDGGSNVIFSLHTEASFYDFKGATSLIAGSSDPFNDVYETALGMSVLSQQVNRRAWFAGFEFYLGGEDNVDLGDALSIGGLGGLRYEVHDDLTITVGLGMRTRLEDDPWVVPFLGFEWQLDENTELVSEGSSVSLRRKLSSNWDLSLGAIYDQRQYRLNDNNPLPGGVLRDESIQAFSGLRWRPSTNTSLDLTAGYLLWREFTTRSSSGFSAGEIETDPEPYFGLQLRFEY